MTNWQPVLNAAVGFLFITAALMKLVTRGRLAPILQANGLPGTVSNLLATSVPVAEASLGSCLVLGMLSPLAEVMSSFLVLGFFGILLKSYLTGVTEACQCFGSLDSDRVSIVTVSRSGIILMWLLISDLIYMTNPVVSLTPRLAISADATAAGILLAGSLLAGTTLLDRVLNTLMRARQAEASEVVDSMPDSAADRVIPHKAWEEPS